MGDTNIEWADAVWNPVRGCTRVSEGCRNCYAEAMAARFSDRGMWGNGIAERTKSGPRWTGTLQIVRSKLNEPLGWKRSQRIFVNSMSDLFHEHVKDNWLHDIYEVMERAIQHTFLILTKRPGRMQEYLKWRWGDGRITSRHIWIGVSIEDQETADERIPLLLQTPAAKRFVSYEPGLGPVGFHRWISPTETLRTITESSPQWLDWIIVGGESGPLARPFDVAWARFTIEQCKAAGVAVFVKQLGARPLFSESQAFPFGRDVRFQRRQTKTGDVADILLSDRKGGDPAEWPEDLRVREFPR